MAMFNSYVELSGNDIAKNPVFVFFLKMVDTRPHTSKWLFEWRKLWVVLMPLK